MLSMPLKKILKVDLFQDYLFKDKRQQIKNIYNERSDIIIVLLGFRKIKKYEQIYTDIVTSEKKSTNSLRKSIDLTEKEKGNVNDMSI